MPIDYRQVDGGLGNVITASGVVTEEEFIGFYADFFSQDEKSLERRVRILNRGFPFGSNRDSL